VLDSKEGVDAHLDTLDDEVKTYPWKSDEEI